MSQAGRSTAKLLQEYMACGHCRAVGMLGVCWVDRCGQQKQWHGMRAGTILIRHADAHLAGHLPMAAIPHQVLRFCSELNQKLRVNVSFSAPPSAWSAWLVVRSDLDSR